MTDPAVAWTNWAVGVLNGISAPVDGTNIASLWNWSNKESGSNVMRWNNPLNTTMPGWGGVDENSVHVKAYPSVVDGIQATVATLLNGRYPTIVTCLRRSIPHSGWQPAAGELITWGTGTNWLTWSLQPPFPGGEDMTPEEHQFLATVKAEVDDLHAAVARIEVVLGTAKPDGSGKAPTQPPPGLVADTHDAVLRIETALKSA